MLGTIEIDSYSGEKETTMPCTKCCYVLGKYGLTAAFKNRGERVVMRCDQIYDSCLKKSDRMRYNIVD